MKSKNPLNEQDYWNTFYKNWAIDIPSQFCVLASTEIHKDHAIVEFGCGNGRDALYFAEKDFRVIAMDLSPTAINNDLLKVSKLKGKFLNLIQGDVSKETDVSKAIQIAREASESGHIIIYTRFFLHTLDDAQEILFIEALSQNLKSSDNIYFEFRATADENETKIYDNHFRRYVDVETLVNMLKTKLNIKEIYTITGKGMAKFKNEDPVVSRLIISL